MLKKKLAFLITFWGEDFRLYAERYCFSSLLCHGNAQSIKYNSENIEFLIVICCPRKDWDLFCDSNIYRLFSKDVEFVFINLELSEAPSSGVMWNMTVAHSNLINYCLENKCFGSFLYPESVVNNGYIAYLAKILNSDVSFSFVNYLSTRMVHQGFLKEIENTRHDELINHSSFELFSIAKKHLHPETLRQNLALKYDLTNSSAFWYKSTLMGTTVFHSLCWAPILINYPEISQNHINLSNMKIFTLDGDYVSANASSKLPIITVQDNTECLIMGFTDTNLSPYLNFQSTYIDSRNLLTNFVYKSSNLFGRLRKNDLDVYKRKAIYIPIILFDKEPHRLLRKLCRIPAHCYFFSLRILGLPSYLAIGMLKCISVLINQINSKFLFKYFLKRAKLDILSSFNREIEIYNPLRINSNIVYKAKLEDLVKCKIDSQLCDASSSFRDKILTFQITNAEKIGLDVKNFRLGITLEDPQEGNPDKLFHQLLVINGLGVISFKGKTFSAEIEPQSDSIIATEFSPEKLSFFINGTLIKDFYINELFGVKSPVATDEYKLYFNLPRANSGIVIAKIKLSHADQQTYPLAGHDENISYLPRIHWSLLGIYNSL